VKRTLFEIVQEILETLGRTLGVEVNAEELSVECKQSTQECTSGDVWWALRSALSYFKDRSRAFPFFRDFQGEPEPLTSDQISICLLEMAVLYHGGNLPAEKRHTYEHFTHCMPCSGDLTSVVVTFFVALEGHDFGTQFRILEQQQQEQLLHAIAHCAQGMPFRGAQGMPCRDPEQIAAVIGFLTRIGEVQRVEAARFLVERFGQGDPPTDEQLERAFAEFDGLPPPNQVN